MNTDLINRLNKAIARYDEKTYNEHDFHVTLESIIVTITEYHLSDFRDFLEKKEAELEQIDFLLNEEYKREKYLKVISEIKEGIKKIN